MVLIDETYIQEILLKNATNTDQHKPAKAFNTDDANVNTHNNVDSETGQNSCKEKPNKTNAFKRIEAWVAYRDRSVTETKQRLRSEGYPESEIEEAVQKAVNCFYLNDERFADALIRKRIAQGKGCKGIEFELKKHHIEVSSIPGYPDSYLEDRPSELDSALALLEKRPSRSKNLYQSAFSKLIRNGYDSNVAYQAAKIWVASKNQAF